MSTVSTSPLGSRDQPSSPLPSALPVPVACQVRFCAFRMASAVVPENPDAPSMNLPLASTAEGPSPMRTHSLPTGCATIVQVLATGS